MCWVCSRWKEQQALKLAEMDKKAAAKHEETVQRARKEIDQFYDEYNQKKAKQTARNRYAKSDDGFP